MIKKVVGLIVLVALTGCATSYVLEGQKYDSKEKFQQAADSGISDALSTITPRTVPLTQRKLVFAIPSEAAIFTESVRRFVAVNGRQPHAMQDEMYRNLSSVGFKATKVFFDAVQKRNIFASTQFIEMQSMTASYAASTDTDTLYFVEPSQGSGQWYYTSQKHGKQIFAYDKSSPNLAGKLHGFIDSVQALAIRD